jgi:type IV secretory pathway VirD2 relaxase
MSHRTRLRKPLAQLGARGAVVLPTRTPQGRHAVVKVWTASPSTTMAHTRYMGQPGKGLDGGPAPLLTDAERPPVDRKRFSQDAQQDAHQFRLIVSVVEGHRLHLTHYIRAYMRHVEQDLGTRLDWVAANHHDTAHTHTHVIIRGTDQDGQDLYLTKHYLTEGLRARAQALATDFLGPYSSYEQFWIAQWQEQALVQAMRQHLQEAKRLRDAPHGMAITPQRQEGISL